MSQAVEYAGCCFPLSSLRLRLASKRMHWCAETYAGLLGLLVAGLCWTGHRDNQAGNVTACAVSWGSKAGSFSGITSKTETHSTDCAVK